MIFESRLPRRRFLQDSAAAVSAAIVGSSLLGMISQTECTTPVAGFGFSEEETARILNRALSRGGDFGELYIEEVKSLNFAMKESKFTDAVIGFSSGLGVRTVDGDRNGYAYSGRISAAEAIEAAAISAYIASGSAPKTAAPARVVQPPPFVTVKIPPQSIPEKRKLEMVAAAEAIARRYSPFVKQVDISYYDESKRRLIANSNGLRIENEIPLVWVVIEVFAEKNGVRHVGRVRISAHQGFEFFDTNSIDEASREAAREAVTMLEARPAPSGRLPVVIESGWGGVLIHEAVGHGLEGDFIYKGTSIYADKLRKKVASDLVTLIDDSSWPNARGTTGFDDEGTIGRRNVLIDKGIVVGFMHDLISAKKLSMEPTGNGRRESYLHYPIPRMTNTFLDNGPADPKDIIADTAKGVYVKSLSGGSVDTISGQFNFIVREAYLIESGRLSSPVSGATLIGRGIDVLTNIDAVANDLKLGVGTCGKDQWVPVTSGIPTLRVADGITVGGTA